MELINTRKMTNILHINQNIKQFLYLFIYFIHSLSLDFGYLNSLVLSFFPRHIRKQKALQQFTSYYVYIYIYVYRINHHAPFPRLMINLRTLNFFKEDKSGVWWVLR